MGDRIKRTNDELKADRPTLDEVKSIPRLPISILVENVRSVHNVGSIFRSADGFGADKIYLTGYTAYPPREDLSKTALGAELAVPWEHNDNPVLLAKEIKKQNIQLVLLEHTKKSQSLYNLDWDFPLCIVLGNEVEGVSEELIALCDKHVEIPMRGIKQSLNVATAAGIIGYEMLRCYNRKGKN